MLKGTRAVHVLVGLLLIFITYVFSNLLQFDTLHWIISKFYSSFILVVIVLFQDDIRRLLTRFGKGPFFSGMDYNAGTSIIEEVINAAKSLSHERIGGLIVFERSIGLDKLYDHSVKLDAFVSEQLLNSIFQSFSPLHDGAVIIQKNRITCASAQLPLSKNPRFSKKLGTRHSAAVGISEETDSVVVVISEETGHISIAWEGNIQKQASPESAKRMLYVLLMPNGNKSTLIKFLEDKIFYTWNQYFLIIKSKFFGKNNTSDFERRKDYPERRSPNGTSDSFSAKVATVSEIASENKMALLGNKSILVKFPKRFHLSDLKSSSQGFVFTKTLFENNSENKLKEIQNQDDVLLSDNSYISFHDNSEDLSMDEKKSNHENMHLPNLAPEERFDPPIPKSTAPRDISIGGVSLNPPMEEQKNKKEMEHQEKNDKKTSENKSNEEDPK